MAALADMVLVVEAREKSGTLITARLALDYNRELGAVPSSIFSDYGRGSNELLKKGAYPITSARDILEILNLDFSKEPKQKKLDLSDFSSEEKMILEKLKEPLSKEELQELTDLEITKVNTTLSILEIKGIITEKLGKFRIK